MVSELRKIIHVDMDCFYAAVECLDDPSLRGKPVVVGGSPFSRGVVSTASYEARQYGIHSAMPTFHAYKRCPHAVFVKPRFERYVEISKQIRDIFNSYSSLVEPLSLDEAYLDVTDSTVRAIQIAQNIRRDIYESIGITASAGVSVNKLVAKVASDCRKPNGITVVLPEQVKDFIGKQSIRKISGVGPKAEEKLNKVGIRQCLDAWSWTQDEFRDSFGNWGGELWERFQGIDHRNVSSFRERKSIGRERTLFKDVVAISEVKKIVFATAKQVLSDVARKKVIPKTLTLKVKYSDFVQITRSQSQASGWSSVSDVEDAVLGLLQKTECGERPVRLLGISFSNLESS